MHVSSELLPSHQYVPLADGDFETSSNASSGAATHVEPEASLVVTPPHKDGRMQRTCCAPPNLLRAMQQPQVRGGMKLSLLPAGYLYTADMLQHYLGNARLPGIKSLTGYLSELGAPLAPAQWGVQAMAGLLDDHAPLWTRWLYRSPAKITDGAAALVGLAHGVSWQRVAWLAQRCPMSSLPAHCVSPMPIGPLPPDCPSMALVNFADYLAPTSYILTYAVSAVTLGASLGLLSIYGPTAPKRAMRAAKGAVGNFLTHTAETLVSNPFDQLLADAQPG